MVDVVLSTTRATLALLCCNYSTSNHDVNIIELLCRRRTRIKSIGPTWCDVSLGNQGVYYYYGPAATNRRIFYWTAIRATGPLHRIFWLEILPGNSSSVQPRGSLLCFVHRDDTNHTTDLSEVIYVFTIIVVVIIVIYYLSCYLSFKTQFSRSTGGNSAVRNNGDGSLFHRLFDREYATDSDKIEYL